MSTVRVPVGGGVRQAALGLAAAAAILGAAWLAAPRGDAGPAVERAQTFEPADASVVLERLPGGARESALLRTMRARLAERPDDPTQAAALARRHLDAARERGDPRDAGRAQAALARWAQDSNAPADVVLMRAAIAQHRHAFDDALADLDGLIGRELGSGAARATPSSHAQALWLRAAVRRATGRLDGAADDCARVDRLARGESAAAAACVADLASLRGDRAAAARLAARSSMRPASPVERGWVELVGAEIAEREGRDADAERAYRAAIVAGTDGPYARVAYADFLLDRQRAAEVDAVLRDAPDTDAVLLRRAIAARRVGDPRADAIADALRARFGATRDRDDDRPHLREQARLALDVDRDLRAAVLLAERNWAEQKEPADALLLLRAARAANRPRAAEPVRAFIAANGLVDVRLEGMR